MRKFFRFRRKEIRHPIKLIGLLPNIITILGLVVGFSSIRFGLDGRWEAATACILVAAILDGADGRLARFLNATSHFGAELDSLCDFVNFGVCPAIILYLWQINFTTNKLLTWISAIIYLVCTGIRLARFNVIASSNDQYFIGVPSPIGAALLFIPMMIDFDIGLALGIAMRHHCYLITIYAVCIGCLLPSRIRTLSLKHLRINPEDVWAFLFLSAVSIVTMVAYPWHTFPILGILYIIMIPFAHIKNTKSKV